MQEQEKGITPIGITNYRNTNQIFGIRDKDRLQHIYVIGKTGTGKSTLLQNMAVSDIERGNGLCVIDPHGDIAADIPNYVPSHRVADVIYFNATDTEYPIAFNPLKGVHPDFHHLVAGGLVSTFKKLWHEFWGPRLEYILRFTLLTLLVVPDATLLDVQPLLTSAEYRLKALQYVRDPAVLAFWINEYDKYGARLRAEAIAPILNKTGAFLTSTVLRNIVGQKTRGFRLGHILDSGKILIVNLSKGVIGEDAATLLGSMLITSIQLAALHRAAIPEEARRPFYLYIDEMHSFMSLSLADILTEARKYRLSLFLTHQYIEQLDDRIRAAVFGNIGTIISFRVGATDATVLSKEFHPVLSEADLVSLPRYGMYIKLMIDGTTSAPFSAWSLPGKGPAGRQKSASAGQQSNIVENGLNPERSNKEEIITESRRRYAHGRTEVEASLRYRQPFSNDSSLRQGSLL